MTISMILKYLKTLIHHATNVYSIITFGFAVVVGILGLTGFTPSESAIFTVALPSISLLVSAFFSSFFAWKDVIDQIPKPGELSIRCLSHEFNHRASAGGMPRSPMMFKITMDIRNRGSESVTVRSISITKFDVNSGDVLGNEPKGNTVTLPGTDRWHCLMSLPYIVEAGTHLPEVVVEIEIPLLTKDAMDFATRLKNLVDYHIELSWHYEDMSQNERCELIAIQGAFENYEKFWIDEWSDPNQQHHHLAIAALKSKGTI